MACLKSHPRKWVDFSDPTYKKSVVETGESPQRKLGDCSDPALHRKRPRPYSSLHVPHTLHKPGLGLPASLLSLFRTHRRRPLFTSNAAQLTGIISEICARHDYHALEYQPRPDQFRCLLSLQPAQAISKVMQTIKTNSSRECSQHFVLAKPVWLGDSWPRAWDVCA
jgi:Transposase IS200 like